MFRTVGCLGSQIVVELSSSDFSSVVPWDSSCVVIQEVLGTPVFVQPVLERDHIRGHG